MDSKVFLAYVLAGFVIGASPYFFNFLTGKQNLFSPIIGIPLDIIGWPLMMYGDYIHRDRFGLPPFILTLVSIAVSGIIIILSAIRRNDTNPIE